MYSIAEKLQYTKCVIKNVDEFTQVHIFHN